MLILFFFNYCRRSAWRLQYSVSINGTELEDQGITDLDYAYLRAELNLTGPSGVKVQLSDLDPSKLVPTSELLSFYMNRYVNYLDVVKVEQELADYWKDTLNVTGNLCLECF